MASVKIDIINQALSRSGNNPIATENDTTAEAVVTLANYEGIVANELVYPWSFAKKWAALNLNTGTPLSTFAYSWRLPADVLTVRRVGIIGEKKPIDFERDAENVYCDSNQNVMALYSYRPTENLWPAYFRELIVQGMEWVCCKGLNESRTTAVDALTTFERTRVIARFTDSKQHSGIDPFQAPLVEAHRG
jgi:hypothetical protein